MKKILFLLSIILLTQNTAIPFDKDFSSVTKIPPKEISLGNVEKTKLVLPQPKIYNPVKKYSVPRELSVYDIKYLGFNSNLNKFYCVKKYTIKNVSNKKLKISKSCKYSVERLLEEYPILVENSHSKKAYRKQIENIKEYSNPIVLGFFPYVSIPMTTLNALMLPVGYAQSAYNTLRAPYYEKMEESQRSAIERDIAILSIAMENQINEKELESGEEVVFWDIYRKDAINTFLNIEYPDGREYYFPVK